MTWLNWSLKLHSGLRTIPHLILTHNTQLLVQLMLISFLWLYMLKCNVYAQLLADQTQKYFWIFYMFLKVILYLRVFSFYSKCILCVILQKLVQKLFCKKLATKCFSWKEVKGKLEISKFIQRLSQLSRNSFATRSFLWKSLCFSCVFRE